LILLLDLGNTRLKAAMLGPRGDLRPLGEANHREVGMKDALASLLADPGTGANERALCANVAGDAAGRALEAGLRARGGGSVGFLRAEREAHGVRCGYPEPARLGADRWAALLGARGLSDGACLVVDAGSALTIDAMAPGGRHLGGWILPGLGMMVGALLGQTGDLAALHQASRPCGSADFPCDTGPAIDEGARLAAAGAVRLARQRLELRCREPARLFLAGGDADALAVLMPGVELVPDLVLRGLARAAA
jgi:type III pantothenate kinase